MCDFCSDFKNKERKFKLFEIKPIPFFTPYQSRRMSDTSAESDKSSDALLESKMYSNNSVELMESSSHHLLDNSSNDSVELMESSSRHLVDNSSNDSVELMESSSHHLVDNSSNNSFLELTNEIREFLYSYQLLNLRTVLFLEGIHIKGFIMNVGYNLVTIIGPNVEVESNLTNNIIGSPNKINVRLDSIQAIADVG
ncbi:hypothetical protein [Bacillus sp. NPDC094077]|uniref:hypothetical protein n=1 Tax=Bacillus sp. NPDC094077 TaxID=3390932 RepID=UPI003CFDABDC